MDTRLIQEKFEKIGARVQFEPMTKRENNGNIPVNFDVRKDKKGEYFRIGISDQRAFNLSVIDMKKAEKHLLLMLKVINDNNAAFDETHKVLCGHDERNWFTCGVPGKSVRNVFDAMEVLKPDSIQELQEKINLSIKDKRKRKNAAFTRQGEWFFLPVNINPDKKIIHKNEPISRGGGSSPHMVEMLIREGGTTVYVHNQVAPGGFTQKELSNFLKQNPKFRKSDFQLRTRDAKVYAKGKVRHRDHKTIILRDWHEVFMNREADSPIAKNIVFLD